MKSLLRLPFAHPPPPTKCFSFCFQREHVASQSSFRFQENVESLILRKEVHWSSQLKAKPILHEVSKALKLPTCLKYIQLIECTPCSTLVLSYVRLIIRMLENTIIYLSKSMYLLTFLRKEFFPGTSSYTSNVHSWTFMSPFRIFSLQFHP